MWKKIKDSKWLYVVLSLLMAAVLWIYVVREANPSIERSIANIPHHLYRNGNSGSSQSDYLGGCGADHDISAGGEVGCICQAEP